MKLNFNKKSRLILWIILLSLTAGILLFPVSVTYGYHAVESLYIWNGKLWLFGALYFAWALLLFLLLASLRSTWEGLFLTSIFILVFWSFWSLISPYGKSAEDFFNLAHVKYLEQNHQIYPSHPYRYFEFPAFHILVYSLNEITNTFSLDLRLPLMVFFDLLFSLFSFAFFVKLFQDSRLASLATILLVTANWGLGYTRHFFPSNLAHTFFPLFLLLTYRLWREDLEWKLILILSISLLTVLHFPTTICAFLILLFLFFLQKFGKQELVKISPSLLILTLTIIVAWEAFVAIITFEGTLRHFEKFAQDVMEGEALWFLRLTGEVHFGERVHLWVKLVRYFWFASYLAGGALALTRLYHFKSKKLNFNENFLIGGLSGVIILGLICILSEAGGEYVRGLIYSGFFTMPIIISSLTPSANFIFPTSQIIQRVKKWGIPLLIIVTFLLSFPTFLAHHHMVTSMAIYPQELSCGEFLEAHTERGKAIKWLFSDPPSSGFMLFYIPERGGYWHIGNPQDKVSLEQALDIGIARFKKDSPSIFLFSKKMDFLPRKNLGTGLDHPLFISTLNKLNESAKIYNNKFTELFYEE